MTWRMFRMRPPSSHDARVHDVPMGRIAGRTSGMNTGETRVGWSPPIARCARRSDRHAHALRSHVKRRNFNASCQRALGAYRHSQTLPGERDYGTIDRARFTRGCLALSHDFPRQVDPDCVNFANSYAVLTASDPIHGRSVNDAPHKLLLFPIKRGSCLGRHKKCRLRLRVSPSRKATHEISRGLCGGGSDERKIS